jgi:hypothetical protein
MEVVVAAQSGKRENSPSAKEAWGWLNRGDARYSRVSLYLGGIN